MQIEEAIRYRKTIRAYQPKEVPLETISELLELAVRAPSATNRQPWQFVVVTGDTLRRLKDENQRRREAGEESHADYPVSARNGAYLERTQAIATEIRKVLTEEEKEQWRVRAIRFFDAPVALILYVDEDLDVARTQYDLGLISQTICLAALGHGLGTCLCLAGVSFPDAVRSITAIPESKKVALSIALGYPDPEASVNSVVSARTPAAELTTWRG